MPSRLLAFAFLVPLFAGCTLAANAEPGLPTPTSVVNQPPVNLQDPAQAAEIQLEAALGDSASRLVTSVWLQNSVLVVAMKNPPTTLSNVDAFWRVCRTLAETMTVPGIAPGQTALVVIQPNGANVLYAVAGETVCKLA